MGLDMEIKRRTHIYGEVEVKLSINGSPVDTEFKGVSDIYETVAYWRKAWSLYHWFEDNVCNARNRGDSSGDYLVSLDKLRDLLSLVKEILDAEDKEKEAMRLLPPDKYGDYSILDDYYFEHLETARDAIEKILQREDDQKDKFWTSYYYSYCF
jgi:hypothetical protein